jgi:hypothetical protein
MIQGNRKREKQENQPVFDDLRKMGRFPILTVPQNFFCRIPAASAHHTAAGMRSCSAEV